MAGCGPAYLHPCLVPSMGYHISLIVDNDTCTVCETPSQAILPAHCTLQGQNLLLIIVTIPARDCFDVWWLLRRCILQLSILGYVLAPLFHFNTWWLVLLYAAAMVAVSSAETVSRPSASYKVPWRAPFSPCSGCLKVTSQPWYLVTTA